jgi:hypothetical protein
VPHRSATPRPAAPADAGQSTVKAPTNACVTAPNSPPPDRTFVA